MLPLPRIRRSLLAARLLSISGLAGVQRVFLARHAIGRNDRMQQAAAAPGGAAYNLANASVEAASDRVLGVVKRRLNGSPAVRVTRADDAKRAVEFSNGSRIGDIRACALGEHLAQLLLSTAHPSIAAAAPTLVQRILEGCTDLGVSCQRAGS